MPKNQRSQSTEPLKLQIAKSLKTESIRVIGRIVNSSNATLLVEVGSEALKMQAIYKPLAGERPLWDFQPGLYKREIAAYQLSEALGLGIVPVTVQREDLPYGVGSLQHFIDADFTKTYYEILEEQKHHRKLIEIAGFDILANNSDRKGGHILIDKQCEIFAIDNGLCFHEEFKLRTVIWEFGKARLSDQFLSSLRRTRNDHFDFLNSYLSSGEINSLIARADFLLEGESLLDLPEDQRPYPWPII